MLDKMFVSRLLISESRTPSGKEKEGSTIESIHTQDETSGSTVTRRVVAESDIETFRGARFALMKCKHLRLDICLR